MGMEASWAVGVSVTGQRSPGYFETLTGDDYEQGTNRKANQNHKRDN